MAQSVEIALKLLVCLASFFALRKVDAARSRISPRYRRALLAGFAVLGVAAYFNFGRFHTDGTPIHLWDQFHYVLGSKYFPELGYDGLYVATLEARQHNLPRRVRDLRTNTVVAVETLEPHRREVRARFSPERWSEFSADVNRWNLNESLLQDHGYNATPTHVAVARLVSPWFAFRARTIYLFMLIDWGLLGVAAWAIGWGFGLEALAMVSLCFGLGACTRYYWTGGAFLRMDYLAALAIAAAMAAKRRWLGAGSALAYATCVRIFPALFLVTLLVAAIFRRNAPNMRVDVRRLLGGFVLAAALCLGAGALSGRGLGVYGEFAQRIRVHSSMVLANEIGVKVAALESIDNLLGKHVDRASYYDVPEVIAEQRRTESERHPWPFVLAALTSLLLVAVVARGAGSPVAALAFGGLLVFCLVKINWYYGGIFLLTILVNPVRSACAFLASSAATYVGILGIGVLDRLGVLRLYAFSVGLVLMISLTGYFLWWVVMQRSSTWPPKMDVSADDHPSRVDTSLRPS